MDPAVLLLTLIPGLPLLEVVDLSMVDHLGQGSLAFRLQHLTRLEGLSQGWYCGGGGRLLSGVGCHR